MPHQEMKLSLNNTDDYMECPLCMEPLEVDDVNFFPCTCGYQICRFCWHRLRTNENGLCPACRKVYPENPANFKPLTHEDVIKIKNEKRKKNLQRKQKIHESRKHLASVRVIQKNLVFVVGISARLADAETLMKKEYFGRFGKVLKVVINHSPAYVGTQSPCCSAYVTFARSEDALRAIQAVNNLYIDGRLLKASLGTTKYCSHFLRNQTCPKLDCMYLHELGIEEASFTKEEMQQGKHHEYEKQLYEEFLSCESHNKPVLHNEDICSKKIGLRSYQDATSIGKRFQKAHTDKSEHLAFMHHSWIRPKSDNARSCEKKMSDLPQSASLSSKPKCALDYSGIHDKSNCSPPVQIYIKNKKISPFLLPGCKEKIIELENSFVKNFNYSKGNNEICDSSSDHLCGILDTPKFDDELGFDPFIETSKALAEMMKNETHTLENKKKKSSHNQNIIKCCNSENHKISSESTPIHFENISSYTDACSAISPTPYAHTVQESFHLKTMQDSLRSLFPNVNISVGPVPHIPSSYLHSKQTTAPLIKGWSRNWNDPAIISSDEILSPPEEFSQWIKSLSETETPLSSYFSNSQTVECQSDQWLHHPPPGFSDIAQAIFSQHSNSKQLHCATSADWHLFMDL